MGEQPEQAAAAAAAISKKTATDIAMAYREVETAEELLAELKKAKSLGHTPDLRDAFGRPAQGLELGLPRGDNSRRLFNVPWSIALPIIEMHIAHHRAVIQVLTQKARVEMAGVAEREPDA